MILNFRHKRLRDFWQTGSRRGLNANWLPRVERILDVLDQAREPDDLNLPGFRFHALIGRDDGRYSVAVNANWRITFSFDGVDVCEVDLEDYH